MGCHIVCFDEYFVGTAKVKLFRKNLLLSNINNVKLSKPLSNVEIWKSTSLVSKFEKGQSQVSVCDTSIYQNLIVEDRNVLQDNGNFNRIVGCYGSSDDAQSD